LNLLLSIQVLASNIRLDFVNKMLCCACQEQPAEVDLGCRHFYCKNCLEFLGGNCRDGCEPLIKMSADDARVVLLYEERQLEALELSASREIAKIERELSETREKLAKLVCKLKGKVEAQYAKIKNAEICLDELLASSSAAELARTIVVKEYAKVHLESNCNYSSERTHFYFWYTKDSDGNRSAQIKGSDNKLVFDLQSVYEYIPRSHPQYRPLKKKNTLYLCKKFNRDKLSIVVKNKSYLVLEHLGTDSNRYIVDLEKRTATRTDIGRNTGSFDSAMSFFRGSDLVTCPVPPGFRWQERGIAIRPHEDPDKFELFDPAVGKLELLITDVSHGLAIPPISSHISLEYAYSSRASVLLASGNYLEIPYLD
jgi:hypothetical protein